jgi:hypothetical protein
MRTIKAAPLLAAAVIAVTAFAGPATASAVEWTTGNGPLDKPEPIELNGNIGSNVGGSGETCPVHAAGFLNPGNLGEITEFDVDGTPTNRCLTFGAFYSSCEITTGTGTVPLSLEAQSTEKVVLKKPKDKFGMTDKVLWTWTFANRPGSSCVFNGQTWKIKGEINFKPIPKEVNWPGFISLQITTTSLEVVRPGGTTTLGFEGNWSVTPSGKYWIF